LGIQFQTLIFGYCLRKEILFQPRIKHFKILQSIYLVYDVGIISSYSNRINFWVVYFWGVSLRFTCK